MRQGFTSDQMYNALDACNTLGLRDRILPLLDDRRRQTYLLSSCLQAPILDMTFRGVLVDAERKGAALASKTEELAGVREILTYIVGALTENQSFNPGSWQQLRHFLHTRLGYEPVILSKKGKKEISTNREALETLKSRHEELGPFIDFMLAFRDVDTLIRFIRYGVDPDGRMRSFFSISGTNTGRLSSSENAFGRGGNLQNITEDLRHLFIADKGKALVNVDLSQADSWNVGIEVFQATGDLSYIDAILSGDLHTYVARMVWPDEAWTGDLKKDREFAERIFYRHLDRRFMCKKAGHGTNYLGKGRTIARQMKVATKLMEDFQIRYFAAFPGLRPWQQKRITELQLNKCLTSILGRTRYFHGRMTDERTWREAIGYLGQSPTADVINTVTMRIHRLLPGAELLIQVHDSLLMQVPETEVDIYVPKILELFSVPITVTSPEGITKTFTIPADAAVGWNWGKRWKKLKDGTKVEAQPDGLEDWRGSLDGRQRKNRPEVDVLDRVLR